MNTNVKLTQSVFFIEKTYYTQNIFQEWLIQKSVSSFNTGIYNSMVLWNVGIKWLRAIQLPSNDLNVDKKTYIKKKEFYKC